MSRCTSFRSSGTPCTSSMTAQDPAGSAASSRKRTSGFLLSRNASPVSSRLMSVFADTSGLYALLVGSEDVSLVDCVSLEFMRQHAIEDVLGLDRHFEEAGHALLRGNGGP